MTAEEWARRSLLEFNEEYSSRRLRKINHHKLYFIILIIGVYVTLTGFAGFVLALNIFSFSYFLYRLIIFLLALKKDRKKVSTKSINLPTYCILLPCKNEPIMLIQRLIENVSNLEYDKSKLDVILLLDENDTSLRYIKRLAKPDYFRIISAIDKHPYTKPKACNIGLYHTEAEIVTIYDAEDEPEKDQLLRVVEKFNEDTELKVIQCELHFKNKKGNLLSALFSLEYLIWFSFMLKGLRRSMKNPWIPLGGTSQHIKVDYLKQIGGWDAYNVTEDADLGTRIMRENGKMTTIDSVTYEIAPTKISDWIKQRTRWNLGYLITSIIHTQNLRKLILDIGAYRTFHLIVNLSLSVFHSAITPILIALYIISHFYKTNTYIDTISQITLIYNIIILIVTSNIALVRRGEYRKIPITLLFPFYYMLHPISAIRSLYKLKRSPFNWEKTPKETFE